MVNIKSDHPPYPFDTLVTGMLVRGGPSWPVGGLGEGGEALPHPHPPARRDEPSWPVGGLGEAILKTIDHLELN